MAVHADGRVRVRAPDWRPARRHLRPARSWPSARSPGCRSSRSRTRRRAAPGRPSGRSGSAFRRRLEPTVFDCVESPPLPLLSTPTGAFPFDAPGPGAQPRGPGRPGRTSPSVRSPACPSRSLDPDRPSARSGSGSRRRRRVDVVRLLDRAAAAVAVDPHGSVRVPARAAAAAVATEEAARPAMRHLPTDRSWPPGRSPACHRTAVEVAAALRLIGLLTGQVDVQRGRARPDAVGLVDVTVVALAADANRGVRVARPGLERCRECACGPARSWPTGRSPGAARQPHYRAARAPGPRSA